MQLTPPGAIRSLVWKVWDLGSFQSQTVTTTLIGHDSHRDPSGGRLRNR